ncbi:MULTISPECIES: AAA family ATPase [unclassified Pseudomonas]|uniref:AAA family ATPase n=1 Tax=unclassified Pseudomonas TaxID=196821 RepID=UPI001CBFE79B|nr:MULTISPECIES: AAA family ATPase [unclassified Pseudomonas]
MINPQEVNRFEKIAIQGWRQFDDIDITLHPRLTILTGANGAGKSSILRVFSAHFGFNKAFLSTPVLVKGQFVYRSGIFKSITKKISSFFKKDDDVNQVGRLRYSNGTIAPLKVSDQGAVQYHLEIGGQQAIAGIHIDSHQAVSNYQTIGSIPSSLLTAQSAYEQYHSEVYQRYHGGSGSYSPLYRMKESLIAMAVFGEGNSRSQGNPELKSALDGFIKILREILPETLGFLDLSIRSPEIVMQTKTGEFLLDSASGGVATLIDFAWRLYMFSLSKDFFVVTMDEPENHLHPSMQRTLLRRLMKAFPQAQFIVATHSPFIVSSVKDSNVYVLRYNHSEARSVDGFVPETTLSRIVSEKLDTINKSSSANEILRDVLGVEATVPEWVTDDLTSIVKRYSLQKLNSDTLIALRRELESLGYQDQYPVALAELVGKK